MPVLRRRRVGEERHRRAELDRVDRTEHLDGVGGLEAAARAAHSTQPRTEHRVREVGPRLVEPGHGVRRAVELRPSPATCGNTNHIQWLALRPGASSASAAAYVPPPS